MVTNSLQSAPMPNAQSQIVKQESTPNNNNNNNNGVQQNQHQQRRCSDNRRSNKPIMEKRRRARINNCLNELKTLILDAMKKDPSRHSKLEKADILEMTVKHLQNLQRQQNAINVNGTFTNKFRAGFSECASEIGKFPGLEPMVKRRLLQHLANCLNSQNQPNNQQNQPQVVPQSSGIILSSGNGTGVQLVPTRLANGDIALILPSTGTGTVPSVPLLVPIVPDRCPSTNSQSSSSTTNYSPSTSPVPDSMYCHKPLSLVVRKLDEPMEEEDKPWRPW